MVFDMKHKLFRKCAVCNRLFAIKKIDKRLVSTEDVEILETLTQPNLRGGIETMVERFVSGERNTYEITYLCRFCGAKHTKTIFKNIKKYKHN